MSLDQLFNKVIKVPVIKLPKPESPDPFLEDENKKNRRTYTYHIEKAPSWGDKRFKL